MPAIKKHQPFDTSVKDYLVKKGAIDLDANRVASASRNCTYSNTFFATEYSRPSATITKGDYFRYVSKFSCTLHLTFPDSGREATVRLRFRCYKSGRMKVWLDDSTLKYTK